MAVYTINETLLNALESKALQNVDEPLMLVPRELFLEVVRHALMLRQAAGKNNTIKIEMIEGLTTQYNLLWIIDLLKSLRNRADCNLSPYDILDIVIDTINQSYNKLKVNETMLT